VGGLALLGAACGVAAIAVPGAGKYLAVGLGLLALVAGAVVYRRRAAPGGQRLAGAAAVALGAFSLLLGSAKVALTLIAIERLGSVLP
jgi:hypothetical protein